MRDPVKGERSPEWRQQLLDMGAVEINPNTWRLKDGRTVLMFPGTEASLVEQIALTSAL